MQLSLWIVKPALLLTYSHAHYMKHEAFNLLMSDCDSLVMIRASSIPQHADFHATPRNSLFAPEFAACHGKRTEGSCFRSTFSVNIIVHGIAEFRWFIHGIVTNRFVQICGQTVHVKTNHICTCTAALLSLWCLCTLFTLPYYFHRKFNNYTGGQSVSVMLLW